MTTLQDRLADLAHEAPPGGAQPGDLWDRGQRLRRRRSGGTIAIVAVTCLLLGGLGWQVRERGRSEEVVLPASVPAALPDRVWEPSPTLPGTDDVGAPGRVALLLTAVRAGLRGTSRGTVAVSAETGRYSFLDLPDQADGTDAALSADGRHVAYWLTGSPAGSPPADSAPVTGFAVYDTSSGEVRPHTVATEHGVTPQTLIWADNATLLAAFYQRNGGVGDSDEAQASGVAAPVWIWELADAHPAVDTALTKLMRNDSIDGGAYGRIWWSGDSGNVHKVVDLHESGAGVQSISLRSGGLLYTSAVDRSGSRAATVNRTENPSMAEWGGAGLSPRPVPGSDRTLQVLAWLDDTHVLVSRAPEGGETMLDPGLSILDVTRLDVQDITEPVRRASDEPTTDGSGPIIGRGSQQVAWELAREPTFRAVPPPDPVDPRVLVSGVLLVLVVSAGLMVWWRRRAVG